ncbi:hypothetical protein CEXT_187261 [Caerostris extrusa]|uniref:Uncharacterized protein n=1 Tax=Caerostris extrusa TaxID=172846 RepID=A0AAV4VS33_CAEEX|nr:hypothetical protein CEXT_187261 [Caerostris extrusa]
MIYYAAGQGFLLPMKKTRTLFPSSEEYKNHLFLLIRNYSQFLTKNSRTLFLSMNNSIVLFISTNKEHKKFLSITEEKEPSFLDNVEPFDVYVKNARILLLPMKNTISLFISANEETRTIFFTSEEHKNHLLY